MFLRDANPLRVYPQSRAEPRQHNKNTHYQEPTGTPPRHHRDTTGTPPGHHRDTTGTPPGPRRGEQQQEQEDTDPAQGLGTPKHLAQSFARTHDTNTEHDFPVSGRTIKDLTPPTSDRLSFGSTWITQHSWDGKSDRQTTMRPHMHMHTHSHAFSNRN